MLKFLVVRGGKAYAAEQEIWEFKKLLFKVKRVHKATSNKRFGLRKLICLAVKNMNNIRSQKYGCAPDAIKEKALESNFEKFMIFIDLYLREPLNIGEKVLALEEQIKRKTFHIICLRAQPKINHSLIVNSCL